MKYSIESIAAYNLDNYLDRNKGDIDIWDVRSKKEYLEGHLKGAINIPYERAVQDRKNPDNDRIVLVYCSRGGRSMRVAKLLFYRGYKVVNVVGGIKAYSGKNIIK